MQRTAKIFLLTGVALLYLVSAYDNWQLNEVAVRGTKGAFPFWLGVASSLVNPLIGLFGIFLVPIVLNRGKVVRFLVGVLMLPALLIYVGHSIRITRNLLIATGPIQWHWWDIKLAVLSVFGSVVVIFGYILLIRASKHAAPKSGQAPN